ncbi:hypothetical protein V8C42DRAFT_323489 [Trichoderma barbatum]
MSPTYTLSAHLSRNLFAAFREKRRSSSDSQQLRPVVSAPLYSSRYPPESDLAMRRCVSVEIEGSRPVEFRQ